MTERRADIAIIGGGLAAHAAAATLADAGADFAMIYPPSPGATALWSGLGSIFGPATEFLEASVGEFGAQSPPAPAFDTDRRVRFERLAQRRPRHPYLRLGLERDEVAAEAAAALESLAYPAWRLLDDERVVPAADATPFAPDIAARSVAASAIRRDEAVGVVDGAPVAGWRAERLAAALEDADGLSVHRVELSFWTGLDTAPEHPVRLATTLANLSTDDDNSFGERLVDELTDTVERLGLDLVILPPLLGRTHEEHTGWMATLRRRLPCRVAEAPQGRWSIHGWRLDRYLRALHGDRAVSARVRSAKVDGDRIKRLHTDGESVEAEAYILASGAWIGGGLPTRAPLVEPIFGLEMWLDGAPIPDPGEVWLPDLFERPPWRDHPLFRVGAAVDASLRPLAYGGDCALDNLFCAGRLLAGTNPFVDGSTEGVDLVTGRRAARSALSHLDSNSITEAV